MIVIKDEHLDKIGNTLATIYKLECELTNNGLFRQALELQTIRAHLSDLLECLDMSVELHELNSGIEVTFYHDNKIIYLVQI